MLLHNYLAILLAAEYSQTYVDGPTPASTINEVKAGMAEHVSAALQLIGAEQHDGLPPSLNSLLISDLTSSCS